MATSDFDISTIIDQTPLFAEQWNLNNTGQTGGTPGADANIINAWSIATGEGIVIGIVDNGIAYNHPDLNNNYNSALSYGFFDPYPDNAHGTLVAGIAVGEGNNDLGIIGAAPNANFANLSWDVSAFYNPLSHQNQEIDIYNNSWTLEENFVELPQPNKDAIENGIREGRGGKGNIYVFSAGNGGLEDNVNYDQFTNSRYTIAVGAIDHNGEHPDYSNPGASLLISGYSGDNNVGVVTTDLTNVISADNYTYFSGTSAAAPLVSGVIALMLEANSNLTWRDVQHILVETAEFNDSDDPEWVKNGAGYDINYKYGFGGIDATAAVNKALIWENVGEELTFTSGIINVNSIIPDNDTVGISSNFTVEEDIDVEWVEVVFDADHSWRGDLEIVLTSPDGTESILAEQRDDDGDDYNNWVFTSARHWGESSEGEWTLTVSDRKSLIDGTWNSWQINLYGTEDVLELTEGTAQIAYVAYYGRPADSNGLNFWNNVLTEHNISYAPQKKNRDPLTGSEKDIYDRIVNQFGNSAETDRLFGRFSNNRDKLNQVYQFAFDRDGDEEGLNFWQEQLDLGNVTLTTFAIEVALGAQNEDIVTLNNKIASADLFSESINTQAEIDAYSGSSGEIFGRDWLENFGDTVSSQAQVNSALDDLVNADL